MFNPTDREIEVSVAIQKTIATHLSRALAETLRDVSINPTTNQNKPTDPRQLLRIFVKNAVERLT